MTDFSATDMSPENKLLLLCACISLDPERQEGLEQLVSGQLDWDEAVRRAVQHRIHPCVYYHLHRLGAQSEVPPEAWGQLERSYAFNAAQSMFQRIEAQRLLRALRSAGVAVIPLKGLDLRERVYPQPALRHSRDLDLLVPLERVKPAEAILNDLGFVPPQEFSPEYFVPERYHHLVPYWLPQRKVVVELHWDLAPPTYGLRIDVEGLWQRATPGLVVDCPVHLLTPEDMLLHLCLSTSITDRFWDALRPMMDLAETVKHFRSQIDWETVVTRADEWRVRPFVYLTLRVADDLLGIGHLEDALALLRPGPFDESLAGAAQQRVLAFGPPEEPEAVSENMVRFLMPGSLGARLQLLRSILFPTRERMACLYDLPPGSPRLLGWYVLRPFQLLGRHARFLLGVARQQDDAVAVATDRKLKLMVDDMLQQNHGPSPDEDS